MCVFVEEGGIGGIKYYAAVCIYILYTCMYGYECLGNVPCTVCINESFKLPLCD